MDWLNRAKQFLGGLFGGAQRTIGQISGNVARAVGQAEQNAARTAQQAVRSVVPKVPTIRLPQINIQAPRIQMPQAPKVDLAGLNRAFQQTQQQVGQISKGFGQGLDISKRTFLGQQLTPYQQSLINQSPDLRALQAVTPRKQEVMQLFRSGMPALDIGLAIKEKGLGAFGPNEIMQRGPLGSTGKLIQGASQRLSETPEAAQLRKAPGITGELARYQQLQATKPSEAIKQPLVGALKGIEQLPVIKEIGNTEAGKFVKENFAKPILKDFITVAQRTGGASVGEKTYAEGLKGYSQIIKDMFVVGTAVYSGGLSAQLGTKGVAFLPTAAKLAPRLFLSGVSQDVIGQLSEGTNPDKIDWGKALASGTTYTTVGVAVPGVTRGVSAGIGKVLGKGQSTIAGQITKALPTDKNAPITVRTLPEKGALRAQGYTNVKVEFTPKPGQVTPTIPGRAIAETAPKAPKGQEALYAEARKYATPEKFANAKINVYHGTSKDFINFDVKKLGSYTNAQDAKLGFHFTDNKQVADLFGIPTKTKGAFLSTNKVLDWQDVIKNKPETFKNMYEIMTGQKAPKIGSSDFQNLMDEFGPDLGFSWRDFKLELSNPEVMKRLKKVYDGIKLPLTESDQLMAYSQNIKPKGSEFIVFSTPSGSLEDLR